MCLYDVWVYCVYIYILKSIQPTLTYYGTLLHYLPPFSCGWKLSSRFQRWKKPSPGELNWYESVRKWHSKIIVISKLLPWAVRFEMFLESQLDMTGIVCWLNMCKSPVVGNPSEVLPIFPKTSKEMRWTPCLRDPSNLWNQKGRGFLERSILRIYALRVFFGGTRHPRLYDRHR